ncbi:MAG: hydroxymethylglutaryl-CoA lyase [Bacteroidetes bacterium]|nr:hydroxymethylglutaryl-CoA lyase [Bacteroidota bacterium]
MIRITETVRDAFQGLKTPIPTHQKIAYSRLLLHAGFDILDVGSFVSPRVIPQMADTPQVVAAMDAHAQPTKIMTLVVNTKGVEQALKFPVIEVLSYPYSVSPTFLKRNLNSSPDHALEQLANMVAMTNAHPVSWVVYLSMGLGNPYGDPWSVELVADAAEKLYKLGIRSMPLSDILGLASPDTIFDTYAQLIPTFPDVDFGLHLHTLQSDSFNKLEAAWEAGVRSFETVLGGLGGCPTAADEMVGNLNTLSLLEFCKRKKIPNRIDEKTLLEALRLGSSFSIDSDMASA